MADAAVKRAFFGQGWHEGGVCPGLGDGVGMVLLGRMAWSLAEASAAIGKPRHLQHASQWRRLNILSRSHDAPFITPFAS